ncbi:MAG TPA: tol-pal system protein YbgF [Methyloprofundus sp.]|nr:tol-pal system protein YbgF [Methyloprofundus sp.]
MKKLALLLLPCFLNVAYADTKTLPPIINNSTYANGAAYSARGAANQPTLKMLGQIVALQTEIQQLRGMAEQQGHEINRLKQREQNIYTDMNMRLQQLESAAGISVDTTRQETLPPPVRQSNIPVVPAVKKTQAKQTLQPAPVKTVKPKSKAQEKADFDAAFASVKDSHYQQAIKLLEQFLLNYPTGVYTDNAYFWLASVYKVVNDLPAAKKNYEVVYTRFPTSEKASMAMLKLANIYSEENDSAKAQQLYARITTQYGGSTAAHMAENKIQNTGQ